MKEYSPIKIGGITCVALLFISSLIYTGCYWDNDEYLYPNLTKCDTTIYTYSGAVQPILNSSCLSCHANSVAASHGDNIKLGTYADVKTYVGNNKLLGTIMHKSGFTPMPKDASKLEDCKITIIEKWIANGAPND